MTAHAFALVTNRRFPDFSCLPPRPFAVRDRREPPRSHLMDGAPRPPLRAKVRPPPWMSRSPYCVPSRSGKRMERNRRAGKRSDNQVRPRHSMACDARVGCTRFTNSTRAVPTSPDTAPVDVPHHSARHGDASSWLKTWANGITLAEALGRHRAAVGGTTNRAGYACRPSAVSRTSASRRRNASVSSAERLVTNPERWRKRSKASGRGRRNAPGRRSMSSTASQAR